MRRPKSTRNTSRISSTTEATQVALSRVRRNVRRRSRIQEETSGCWQDQVRRGLDGGNVDFDGPSPNDSRSLTLGVKVDGETVVDTEPDLGYIHRGVEKICEARDFTQITTYCDRLCYASANTWSHSYIYAAEDLLGVEVSERAEYIRLIAVDKESLAI